MAAINGAAMHRHQAEAAALTETQTETQCINFVIGGNDPKWAASLPPGQLPGCLDQGGPSPVPLPARMKRKNLAPPPVLPRHMRWPGSMRSRGRTSL